MSMHLKDVCCRDMGRLAERIYWCLGGWRVTGEVGGDPNSLGHCWIDHFGPIFWQNVWVRVTVLLKTNPVLFNHGFLLCLPQFVPTKYDSWPISPLLGHIAHATRFLPQPLTDYSFRDSNIYIKDFTENYPYELSPTITPILCSSC